MTRYLSNTMLYSIIIPHHNIPKLLERCLGSIPRRDDVQVVVVDDGSSNEAVTQCKEIEKKFSYVEFCYSRPAHGGGFARNLGIQKARGKYVLFADADDYFNPCANDVLDEYKDCDKDLVFFNANSLDTEYYTFCHRCWQINHLVDLYSRNERKALYGLRYKFGEPWCKLIKREVLVNNGVRFNETIIHNDTTFSYKVGYYCQTFDVDKRALYCVTHRSGSVSKQVSAERWLIRTEVFARANAFFKLHNIAIADERAYRGMFHFMLKHDLKSLKKCFNIINNTGESKWNIFVNIALFPYRILQKVTTEYHIKNKLKNNIK